MPRWLCNDPLSNCLVSYSVADALDVVDEKVCGHSNSQVVSDGIIDFRWYKLFVKLLILLLFVLLLSTLTGGVDTKGYYHSDGTYVPVATLTGDADVKGYYRSDDTYVQPHYRSTPDGNPYNNYSYPDNIDPYTGNPDTHLNRYYFKDFDLKDSYQRQIDSLQQQIKLLEMKLKRKQFKSPTTTSRYTPSTKNKGYEEFEKEKDFMNREFFTVTNVIWGVLIVIVIVSSN